MQPVFALILATIVAGLILGNLTLYVGCRRFVRLLHGQNEVPLYRGMSEDALPPAARRFLEKQTARIVELGFRSLGDYRVRTSIDHYCRLFLDDSGTIAGELAYFDALFRKRRVTCFFSLLDNLDCAETGDGAVPPLDEQIVLRGMPRASIETLLAAHRELLATLQAGRRVLPVEIEANDLPLVATYISVVTRIRFAASHPGTSDPVEAALPELRAAVEQLVPQGVA